MIATKFYGLLKLYTGNEREQAQHLLYGFPAIADWFL